MIKRFFILTATMLLLALNAQTAVASEAAAIFKQYDFDRNGVLTLEEVEANADLAENFDDGDTNNDGKLDMVEFEAMEVTDE